MANRIPLAVGEWYHCYNRGVDKRIVFQNRSDYERFLVLMYAGNSEAPIYFSSQKERQLQHVLITYPDRGAPLVEIGAYCLMPNHFHFMLKEIRQGGIALFMQKIFTGYTIYFNQKNERMGALFAGTFKSKHVGDDRYLRQLLSYIHCNPIELFAPRWKEGKGSVPKIEKWLGGYQYSSLLEFSGGVRLERKLLGDSIFELFELMPSIDEMLKEARAYYEESNLEV